MIIDGYCYCSNKWALDSTIKNELPLLLIISSMTAKTGECFANNRYFAGLMNCTETSISTKISKLIKKGYIVAEYDMRGAEVVKRVLRISNPIGELKYFNPTDKKILKDNNKKTITTSNSRKLPTKEEVEAYAKTRNRTDLASKFYDYFTATDWYDKNGNKVKNWKAKFVTWEAHTPKPKEQQETWWRE